MSTVAIVVAGNDITASVIFGSASFEQSMNAVPGSFQCTVRDPNRTLSFSTGKEMSLTIDGVTMFGGYVTQVSMTNLAPAADTSTLADYNLRVWVLRGTDYNIIFDRRVLRNTSNYLKQIAIPISTDGAMITTVVEDYTDCSDFTTGGISSSATVPGSGNDLLQQGIKLREPFQNYSFFGGTVWYIDGSKNFIYVPFEAVEKRWGFSDSPNSNSITVSPNQYQGATIGFREVEGVEDGTYIENDVLVWGGSPFAGSAGGTVFARAQDATSQSTYGRWQFPETHFGEKTFSIQAQVDARADVILNGPPGADIYGQQKGLRYAQWQFTFTWFGVDVPRLSGVRDHLVPGDIVTIDLEAFGVTKLLPLRSLRTSFPDAFEGDGSHLVQFEGTFGLQISDPFTLWRYLLTNQNRVASLTALAVNDTSTQTIYGANGQFTPTPATDSSTTLFSLPFGYVANSLQIYQGTTGGVGAALLRAGIDFTETDFEAGTFTMTVAPPATDYLVAICATLAS